MYIIVTVFLSTSFFSRESLSTFFDDDSDAASRISCHSKLSVGQTPTLFLRLFHMFFSIFCPSSVSSPLLFCPYHFPVICLLFLLYLSLSPFSLSLSLSDFNDGYILFPRRHNFQLFNIFFFTQKTGKKMPPEAVRLGFKMES